jgi:hypothetical protein
MEKRLERLDLLRMSGGQVMRLRGVFGELVELPDVGIEIRVGAGRVPRVATVERAFD